MGKIVIKPFPRLAGTMALALLSLPGCDMKAGPHDEGHLHTGQRIMATTPQLKTVTLTQPFVCQLHSQRHIAVRALERGYLQAVNIQEGQRIKAGDVMFKVITVIYQKKADAEQADADRAQLQYNYTKKLAEENVVSTKELALLKAKLGEAQAIAQFAAAELDFATVKAPFDGIIDRLHHMHGSLVEEGEILTTLSDNSVMWVYFNVPEKDYLEYMTDLNQKKQDLKIELMLAGNNKFNQLGKISAIEADFNNQTGTVPFRADFSNPERLLRHGQTGTVMISRVQNDAVVIPQRATFEVLQKRYVYVIDKDHVAHQREIGIQKGGELDDIFVIEKGLTVNDKIVLEGIRQIRDGEKVEYENRQPGQVAAHLKYHAE